MQYKQKKMFKKILLFFLATPIAFLLVLSLLDKITNKNYYTLLVNLTPFNKVSFILFLVLIIGVATVADEIICEEISMGGKGVEIKKGEVGYHLMLSIHILSVLSLGLLFLYEQFY